MIDNKSLYKISYGLYLLSAQMDGRDNACITNAVMQVTSKPPQLAVALTKTHLTHEFIEKTGKFNISVLTRNVSPELFGQFGYQSGRDVDKFADRDDPRTGNGIVYLKDAAAVFSGEVVSSQDLGTHTLFVAHLTEAKSLVDAEPLTYAYYQQYFKRSNKNTLTTTSKEGTPKMKKYICTVCGYVHEGDSAPEFCPLCKAPQSKFKLVEESSASTSDSTSDSTSVFATVHAIGDGKVDDSEILDGLRANFNGECTEVGMYLAMSRQADREGYPEIAEAYKRIAFEEAEHAAKFAELLGEVVVPCTKTNLKMRVDAEAGACAGKFELAKKAKQLGFDAIHDTVHEMAKDEARHGSAFAGLLKRYFGE